MKSSTIWIVSIVGFLLLASGQLNNLIGSLLNGFNGAAGGVFSDYMGSDGMMHSGLIRFMIIAAIIGVIFMPKKSFKEGDVVDMITKKTL